MTTPAGAWLDEHAFNSAWYGEPVGIVREAAAMAALDEGEARAALDRHAFVELRCAPEAVERARMTRLGFFLADTQIHFRLGLKALQSTPSVAALELRWADEAPFTVEAAAMAPFRHERFQHLPGMTAARLAERYARWARDLIAAAPATCARLALHGVTQGWFLSEPRGARLRLALAMTAADATVTGLHLYLAAGLGYAARGHGVGEASFSVHNTAVLNIYAHLGARFVATEDTWLRVRGA